jgi:hypothetical protein
MAQITFHPNSSSFHNAPGNKAISVAGKTFPIVKNIKTMPRGYDEVYVDATAVKGFPNKNIRVRVTDNNYMIEGGMQEISRALTPAMALTTETDEEIIVRMRERFEMLEALTGAAKKGKIKSLIISGPAGVGKSHGVERKLSKHNILSTLSEKEVPYTIIKGAMSPIGLYKALYKFRDAGKVVVFDDCDTIFEDTLMLNILKAALDSKARRTICWNTESRVLDREGIPDRFDFQASAIFLTNIDFETVKSNKLKPHLDALTSRSHYMSCDISTDRERLLRIKQVAQDGLLKDFDMTDAEQNNVLDFVTDNFDKLREQSLRTVVKAAELKSAFGDSWQKYAAVSLLK